LLFLRLSFLRLPSLLWSSLQFQTNTDRRL